MSLITDKNELADELLELIRDLYPISRSITGDGVRETLRRLAQLVPIEIHEVPTGTNVLDWEVPREWNIKDAYIKNSAGQKVIDFEKNNLHVMGYSVPVRGHYSLKELRPHLYSDPAHPDWVPYRTGYYAESWGFCLSHRILEQLGEDSYEVVIDSTLEPGNLTYGEVRIPGESDDEFIVYSHTCHPSLCNDNLSGLAVCAHLAAWLAERDNQLSYRFIFGPGTIGSITWLALNEDLLPRIKYGLVIALVGNSGPLHYKKSRIGDARIDRVVEAYLRNEFADAKIMEFSPWGYDERQFGSPGFKLPVGRLTRAQEEGYPEYHSSADNIDIIDRESIVGSLLACSQIIEMADSNSSYLNLSPKGEPQLGRRGIYRKVSGSSSSELQRALLWVLNYSDGETDLVEICERSRIPFTDILEAARMLAETDLLKRVP